jgi:putative ABC transport system permease protein
MKFIPLAWAALWRNRTESVLTLCALSVAFALFGAVISLYAAYERAIVDTRMDRLTDGSQFASSDEKLGLAAMAAL